MGFSRGRWTASSSCTAFTPSAAEAGVAVKARAESEAVVAKADDEAEAEAAAAGGVAAMSLQGRPRQPTVVVQEAMEGGWREVTLLEEEGKFNEAAECQASMLVEAKALYDDAKLKLDNFEATVS